MSNPNGINERQLTPDAQIFVRGQVRFSRITSHIEGDELEKDKIRRNNKGWIPIEKPYTSITIDNARIEQLQPNTPLTIDEQYVQEKMYQTKDGQGMAYTMNNKSPYLPNVTVVCPNNPSEYNTIRPQGELDRGLDVTLCLRVFSARNHNGLSLDAIMVHEPIRYYSASSGYIRNMAARGIIIKPMTPEEQAKTVPKNAEKMPLESDANGQTTTEPISSPTAGNSFVSTPQPATNNQPATQTPTPFPQAAQTAQPVQNAQNTNQWTCACGAINSGTANFCQSCGTKRQDDQFTMNPPAQETPASPWVCSCGVHNAANQNFCGSCGNKRPEAGNQPNGNVTPTAGISYVTEQ